MDNEQMLWIAFAITVVVLLFLDFAVFNRHPENSTTKKAAIQTVFFISVALIFGLVVWAVLGSQRGMEYFTGYILEESMSVDNLFVFIIIFSFFAIPSQYQHKVLFYGVIGAIVFRLLFILAGVELIKNFDFVLYIFGAILIVVALKTMFAKDDSGDNKVAVFMSKHLHASADMAGGKFFTVENGKRLMTPLFVAVIVIEVSDIIFAIDSIPAILSITDDMFVVYSSNIFAILGLRSLYFVLRDSMTSLKYLKYGLGIILLFIGVKIFISKFVEIPVLASLLVIIGVLAVTVVASLISQRNDARKANGE